MPCIITTGDTTGTPEAFDELMEHLWSPWRFKYITAADQAPGCVFCRMLEFGDDTQMLILHRGENNFIVLNKFPYSNGHLMIVPYAHVPSLAPLPDATSNEMMALTKRAQSILEQEYKPNGLNIGVNIGQAAGAGVAEHVHLHVVPRWVGDANFMTIVGETRVMPEELGETYARLKKHFPD